MFFCHILQIPGIVLPESAKNILKGICLKRRNFMKQHESQYRRLLHNYVCVTVIITSVILIVMGVFAAKNNTEALDSGIQPAMIYAAREDEAISVKIDKSVYTSEKLSRLPAETILSLSPAPVSNIYLIYKNIKELTGDRLDFIFEYFS